MSSVHIRADARYAPQLRRRIGVGQATLLQALALTPPLGLTLAGGGVRQVSLLSVAIAVTLFWEVSFALLRRRAVTWHGVTTAMIFVVMVPALVPFWQVGIALSLGFVLGELVFGGRGFGFLNAGAVALAFLLISFPGVDLAANSVYLPLAVLPGTVLLLVTGLISWRVLLASAISFAAVAQPDIAGWATASVLVFGLIFLVADPFAAAETNDGRWLYGAMAGGLVALFGANQQAVVFAAILASLFAPLSDQVTILIRKRRPHRG